MNLKTEDFFRANVVAIYIQNEYNVQCFKLVILKWSDVICYLENFEINIINKQIK